MRAVIPFELPYDLIEGNYLALGPQSLPHGAECELILNDGTVAGSGIFGGGPIRIDNGGRIAAIAVTVDTINHRLKISVDGVIG